MPSIVTWDTDYVPESTDTNPFNPRRNPRRQRCSDGPCLTHGERQTVQQIVQMHAASEKQSQNSHLGNLLLGSTFVTITKILCGKMSYLHQLITK